MSRLAHWYHVYAIDTWEEIVTEHLTALEASGLASEIGKLHLGIIGPEPERRAVIALCKKYLPVKVAAEADAGWEQPTLESLRQGADSYDAVLYAHTKGITYKPGGYPYGGYPSVRTFYGAWRQSMTRAVVNNWLRCVTLLESHDAVGCHWVVHPKECIGSAGEKIEAGTHLFAGNFWWANAAFIRGMEPPETGSRYDAEMWFGHNGLTDVYDLTPGWPSLEAFRPSRRFSTKGVPMAMIMNPHDMPLFCHVIRRILEPGEAVECEADDADEACRTNVFVRVDMPAAAVPTAPTRRTRSQRGSQVVEEAVEAGREKR